MPPFLALPDYPPAFWVTAVLAVIFIGIAKAGFGGGVMVVATPLLALTIPVTEAAALLLPLLILCDMFAVAHYRTEFHRPSLKALLPGAMVGIVLGALFFGYFASQERVLQIGIGAVAVGFVLYQAGRVLLGGALNKRQPTRWEGPLLGSAGGFLSTLAHAGGPPVVIYLLPQQLERQLFVGTSVIFFTVVNLVKLIPYTWLNLITVGNLSTIALLSPLTLVGVRLGIYLNQHFSELWFNRVVYVLLLLTGVRLLLG